MEIVKEFFGAVGGRLRSHFIGSILLSMLAFNWNSVLFLLMDGNSVWMKIAYTEKHWQIMVPAILGLAIGFANPYIVYVGAKWTNIPSTKLHSLQDQTKHKRAMQLLENEAIENAKKAELAKSTDEALKTIDDDDIRERLKEKTSTSTEDVSQTPKNPVNSFALTPDETVELWGFLSPLERNIIKRMGKRKGILLTIMQDENSSSFVQIDGQAAPKATVNEFVKAMLNLHGRGLVQNRIPHSNKVGVYELTEIGSAFSRQISQMIV